MTNERNLHHIPGLWASECHPVEDGMDIEMPDGYAVVKVGDVPPWLERVVLADRPHQLLFQYTDQHLHGGGRGADQSE
jgi:hypothetical protein